MAFVFLTVSNSIIIPFPSLPCAYASTASTGLFVVVAITCKSNCSGVLVFNLCCNAVRYPFLSIIFCGIASSGISTFPKTWLVVITEFPSLCFLILKVGSSKFSVNSVSVTSILVSVDFDWALEVPTFPKNGTFMPPPSPVPSSIFFLGGGGNSSPSTSFVVPFLGGGGNKSSIPGTIIYLILFRTLVTYNIRSILFLCTLQIPAFPLLILSLRQLLFWGY